MAKAHIKRLQRAAARITKLNAMIDDGDVSARQSKKAMQGNYWEKRGTGSLFGFFDQKKAREIKRGTV